MPDPLLIDTRTEAIPVDNFDRVSIAYATATAQFSPSTEQLGIAYSGNGNITVKSGHISGSKIQMKKKSGMMI